MANVWIYHIGSNLAGLLYIVVGYCINDMGYGILDSCAMMAGTFLE